VTLEDDKSSEEQMKALLDVCETYRGMKFIFTKANADATGRIINKMIDDFVEKNDHAIAVTSLGMIRYLSALKYCSVVIGNSSSGLIEAPSFKVPTINIGDRQKGRMQAESVIHCKPNKEDIQKAMEIALSEEFKKKVKNTVNPYGDGNTSERVVKTIRDFVLGGKIHLKKKFYDCEVR
ncbi:MAG TPA: UDP-N-acetylglucosamine 2-epimerase (hydrolyzing), partial [Clostridiales bacterium]|nr:UDP-N-acetylglucosamine 2-epimerase (hydrolyzing) [Clostridiales bacterium]